MIKVNQIEVYLTNENTIKKRSNKGANKEKNIIFAALF